jgi:hypothetical protein
MSTQSSRLSNLSSRSYYLHLLDGMGYVDNGEDEDEYLF